MQITLKQLDAQLTQCLQPWYCLAGDEPLLARDVRETIVRAAQLQGFFSKEIMTMDTGFQLESLISALSNYDLFSEKKIIDIRHTTGKWDAAFTDFLKHYLTAPQADRIVIFSTHKLTTAQQKTAWCESIKKHGVLLLIYPVSFSEFPKFIMMRAQKYQLNLSEEIAKKLSLYCEGNILAVQQALEKLQLLFPATEITREQLSIVLSDQARYTIFDLSDALFQQDARKMARILRRLQQVDAEPTLVLWSVCRALREKSHTLYASKIKHALQKAVKTDEIIKGAALGDVWESLLSICLRICRV